MNRPYTGHRTSQIWTIPNILSMFRLCLIPLIVWLYCKKMAYEWTAAVLLLSGATDIVDGYIARHFHMTSDLGKILDPVADKCTQGAMLICLLSRFPLMWVPLVLLILKELYMGLSGALVIRKTGEVMGANWHGKAATCLLWVLMVFHVLWPDIPQGISDIAILTCTGMMLLSLILYGIRNTKVLRRASSISKRSS